MTAYDYFAYITLFLAIGVNCLSVYLQKKYRFYNNFGKNALLVHSTVIGVFWAIFIGAEFLLSKSSWQLSRTYPIIGGSVMLIALGMFIAAIKQIGRGALGNSNFFGGSERSLKGVYEYIAEPIYWSYCIWFFGLAFVTGQKGFFVITAIAIIGLIGIEARVERVKV